MSVPTSRAAGPLGQKRQQDRARAGAQVDGVEGFGLAEGQHGTSIRVSVSGAGAEDVGVTFSMIFQKPLPTMRETGSRSAGASTMAPALSWSAVMGRQGVGQDVHAVGAGGGLQQQAGVDGGAVDAAGLQPACAAFQAVSRVGASVSDLGVMGSVMGVDWPRPGADFVDAGGAVDRSRQDDCAPPSRLSPRLQPVRPRLAPSERGRVWKFAAAAGVWPPAGAAHLLYSQGHKVGVELRAPRPEPCRPSVPTPGGL